MASKFGITPPTMQEMAASYIALGAELVVIARGGKLKGKQPKYKGWLERKPAADEFGGGVNLSIKPGPKSDGIIDLDFDTREAKYYSGLSCIFAAAPGYRRKSLPREQNGHCWVRCIDAPDDREVMQVPAGLTTKQGKALDFGKPILEIRAGGGIHSVAPPSILDDSDQLVWNCAFPPAIPVMPWPDVHRRAGLLAFISIASRAYPDQGTRHYYCLWLAGALADIGVPEADAEEIVQAVVAFNGDDVRERIGIVHDTFEKAARGEAITTLHTYFKETELEAIEPDIRRWLDLAPGSPGRRAAVGAIAIDRPDPHIAFQELAAAFRDRGLIYSSGPVSCVPSPNR